MPETVLFGSERQSTRADVASYLRTVADRLETGETVTLVASSDLPADQVGLDACDLHTTVTVTAGKLILRSHNRRRH